MAGDASLSGLLLVLKSSCRSDAALAWDASLIMGDVISSHLDEAKREIITGKESRGVISAALVVWRVFHFA